MFERKFQFIYSNFSLILDNERWKQADVPTEFQDLVDYISSSGIALNKVDDGTVCLLLIKLLCTLYGLHEAKKCVQTYTKCTDSDHPSTALVAQLDAPSDWRPGGYGFNPRRGWQHSFVEIDHEIFSTVILSHPLIQEG